MKTHEMGDITALLITETRGVWEEDWRRLQGTPFEDSFTRVPNALVDDALKGWSKPFVAALRVPPEGALKKIPPESRVCFRRFKCPFYEARNCHPEAKKMPWCYEPDEIEGEEVRQQATRAIEYWRDKVYLVVVREDKND